MVRRRAFGFGEFERTGRLSLPAHPLHCRLTLSVPASRFISLHFKPRPSPMRRPVVIDRTYNASNFSPLAASKNLRACSGSSGVISLSDLRRINSCRRIERYQVEPHSLLQSKV